MSSEKGTESQTSELFPGETPDPVPGEAIGAPFEPLGPKPKSAPNSIDGSTLGTLGGFKPLGNAEVKLLEQIPPASQRKGSYYYGIRFYYEEAHHYTGHKMKVVCAACGTLWAGRWKDIITVNKQGTRDPVKSWLLPRLAGQGVIALPGKPIRVCQCTVGSYFWGRKLGTPVATDKEIQAALELDQELAEAGARLLENAAAPKRILSAAVEAMLKAARERLPEDPARESTPTPKDWQDLDPNERAKATEEDAPHYTEENPPPPTEEDYI